MRICKAAEKSHGRYNPHHDAITKCYKAYGARSFPGHILHQKPIIYQSRSGEWNVTTQHCVPASLISRTCLEFSGSETPQDTQHLQLQDRHVGNLCPGPAPETRWFQIGPSSHISGTLLHLGARLMWVSHL